MESPDSPELIPTKIIDQIDEVDNAIEALEIENDAKVTTNADLWPAYCDPSYIMPPEIEVRNVKDGEIYYINVKIVKQNTKKLYLGGYRNKLTGVVYHHASSQTPTTNKVIVKDTSRLRTRETQTIELRTLSQQTYSESGTQMQRIDLHIDNSRDKEIKPKRYITADQVLAEKKIKCIIIQRYWRGVMARERARGIRLRNEQRDRLLREEYELQLKQDQEKREIDMQRRLNPKSKSDFEILFNELNAWSKNEYTKIDLSTKTFEEKQQAKSQILLQVSNAINSIEILKQKANKNLKNYLFHKKLDIISKPEKWQLSNGEIAYVETPQTLRAKYLYELYNELCLIFNKNNINNRLMILLKIKNEVKQFDFDICDKLIAKIDEEADLLNRDRPIDSMKNLRESIRLYFEDLIRMKEFNPKVVDVFHNKSNESNESNNDTITEHEE